MSLTKPQLEAIFVHSMMMVKEFHEVFGHPVGLETKSTLSETRAVERGSYLFEELQEGLIAAIGKQKVKVVDAFADAVYFACGNLIECGFPLHKANKILFDLLGDNDSALLSFAHIKEESDEYGWSRYTRNVFIGSLSEVSTQLLENLGGANQEKDILVENYSIELAFAFLAIMSVSLDVDPLAVMTEVHRSNMSKLLPAELPDEDACRFYMAANGCPLPAIELKFERLDDGRWIAKNMGTNKVVKNPFYSEADLTALVS
tara:strand:+ start:614 stop:1393 length:780 start_codon:yes stop_codon:yes gene_type:complete